MRYNKKRVALVSGVAFIGIAIQLSVLGGIVWAAVHFIRKFW